MKSKSKTGETKSCDAPTTDAARRRFLAKAGKFAVATPPAMTMLLASSKQNYAMAQSGGGNGGGGGGGRGGRGRGNHGNHHGGHHNNGHNGGGNRGGGRGRH